VTDRNEKILDQIRTEARQARETNRRNRIHSGTLCVPRTTSMQVKVHDDTVDDSTEKIMSTCGESSI
jgi:hypothetical protein